MAAATPEANVYVRNLTNLPLYIRLSPDFRIRLNRRGVADNKGPDVGLVPSSLADNPIFLQNVDFTIEVITSEEYQTLMADIRTRKMGGAPRDPSLPEFGGLYKQEETVVAIETSMGSKGHLDHRTELKAPSPQQVEAPGSTAAAPKPPEGHALPDNAFPKVG